MNGSFFRGVFVLAGTTIGAGIFGIPYVTATVGYPLGLFWLVFFTIFTLALNLAYAYVINGSDDGGEHQLVSYATKYFGALGRKVGMVVVLFGQWGPLLAYIIGAGIFLHVIFNFSLSPMFFSLVFFCLMALVTLLNLKLISFFESWLTYGMVTIVIVIAISGLQILSVENFSPVSIDLLSAVAPVGVIIGALNGFVVIPEVKRSIENLSSKNVLYWAVAIGTLIPAAVYAVFQFVVVGVSGQFTSEDAISGLVPYLDEGIIRIGALFGVFAMASSFMALTYVLKHTFQFDFKMTPFRSWFLAIVPPLVVYLAGVTSFILVLDVGGFWSGISGAILVFGMFLRHKLKNNPS